MLGSVCWRVNHKPDMGRSRDNYEDKRELLIEKVVGWRFKYEDESEAEYLLHRHGSADGVPDDVTHWGDLYEGPPTSAVHKKADLYVHESDTGTKHLVSGRGFNYAEDGLRGTPANQPVSCVCGRVDVPVETLAEGLPHYAEYLHEAWETWPRDTSERMDRDDDLPVLDDLDPSAVLGDDLCGGCFRSYGKAEDDEVFAPVGDGRYRDLVDWQENRSQDDLAEASAD
jgi:hypothetical protein